MKKDSYLVPYKEITLNKERILAVGNLLYPSYDEKHIFRGWKQWVNEKTLKYFSFYSLKGEKDSVYTKTRDVRKNLFKNNLQMDLSKEDMKNILKEITNKTNK